MMKPGMICCLAAAAVTFLCGVAAAGDDFGIPTYPGAKSDAETRALCAEPDLPLIREREKKAGLTAAKHCYRTKDSVEKVAEFYKKQKGLTGGMDAAGMGAAFCLGTAGCNESTASTGVSIANFWIVPKSMKVNNDVLIVVTNRVKK
jgi:hypothetical protein